LIFLLFFTFLTLSPIYVDLLPLSHFVKNVTENMTMLQQFKYTRQNNKRWPSQTKTNGALIDS